MIRTFADRDTKELYTTGRSKCLSPDIRKRAIRKLEYIDLALRLEDLKTPPGNRLHALSGDRKGQYAIAINARWRICFRFENGEAYDVEVCNYH